MQFPKHSQLEKSIARKDVRYYLNNAHLDTENKRLLACDGHRALVLPVTLDDGDTSGPISAEAIKAARKGAGKMDHVCILANGDLKAPFAGVSLTRPDGDYTYPDVDRIVPKAGTAQVAFNADYLAELQAGLGGMGVVLQFALNPDGSVDGNSAIRVTGTGGGAIPDAVGVLMPMRF